MIDPFTATGGGQTPDEPQPVGSTGPRLAEAFQWIAQNDPTTVAAAKVLVRAGGAVVMANPTGPDQKAPWDLRTPDEKKSDGDRLGSDRSKGGVWSATTDPDRLDAILERAEAQIGQPPNIGLNVGLSGLVLVDCDQADQVEAVQKMAQPDDPEGYVSTTRSPGVQRDDDTWHHSGGGHFLFYDDIGLGPVSQFTMESGADVYADGGRYVMVPPSKRDEGKYEVTGPVRPLSSAPWLTDTLAEVARERAAQDEARAARAEASQSVLGGQEAPSGSIGEWNDAHRWDDLLPEVGMVRLEDPEKCGCPLWHITGRGSKKSAVAHEPGCTESSVTMEYGSGPVHFWTSDLPGPLAGLDQDRFTKAQFVAHVRYGGDFRAFAEAEGLGADLGDLESFRMDGKATPAPSVSEEELEDFWSSSDVLAKIRDRAIAKRVSPSLVLLAVLATVSYVVPPTVRIPGIIGRPSPLNLYVGVVGESGAGKGAATGVARELLGGLPYGPVVSRLGTGEGLYRLLGVRPSGKQAMTDRRTYRRTAAVLLDVPEVTELNNLTSKEGATITSALLQAWSGEAFGSSYADVNRLFSFPAMSYRLSMLVGVQPEASEALLAKDSIGLPQRMVFVSTNTTAELPRTLAPDLSEDEKIDVSHILDRFGAEDRAGFRWHHPGEVPAPLVVHDDEGNPVPNPDVLDGVFPVFSEVTPDTENVHTVTVCQRALDAVWDADDAKKQRPYGYVPSREERLNAHRLLNTVRVASLLSFLQGGTGDVGDREWDQALVIFSLHDDAVAEMFMRLDKAQADRATATGKAQGHQRMAADEVVLSENEKKAELARAKVIKYLGGKDLEDADGWASLTRIRRGIPSTARGLAPEALDDLVADGVVESREGEKAPNGKVPVLYRLT